VSAPQEILHAAENPIWNVNVFSKEVREPDAYASNKEEGERWQDKSTGATERLRRCLHIQVLATQQGAMSLTAAYAAQFSKQTRPQVRVGIIVTQDLNFAEKGRLNGGFTTQFLEPYRFEL
ncbi:hypothetical protein, partial [Bradyrhizobium stylosanthis]|uniref:hypothetical protein n=1 Tax=Bradyrhizobium stylosanthis TaxID=1803665 RepID=UPI001AEE3E8E